MKESYRMHSMPYAQCHVNIVHDEDGAEVELVSYNTSVCIIRENDNGITLYCSGTYSNTTARHINRFTTEFLGCSHYHECKVALDVDWGSVPYPGFVWVIKYGFDSPAYEKFCDTIERYENDSFSIGQVRKYYGSY